jgi:hypothetical protein
MAFLGWVSLVLVILAFAAGLVWQKVRLQRQADDGAADAIGPVQRVRALGLLDSAVEAKNGQLWSEAARLAVEARQTDPTAPGVDIFLGELALEQGDTDTVGSAAQAALQRDPASASAKLLLALKAWMLRGQTGSTEAGAVATQMLQEAAADEMSNGAVRFFAGDFLRAIGRSAEAHANLLGGLHRQHPWHSAAMIAAKLQLAVHDAGPSASLGSAAFAGPEVERFGLSAGAFLRAARGTGDAAGAASALRRIFTAKQIALLFSDPALAKQPAALVGPSLELSVPFGGLAPPADQDRAAPPVMPWEREAGDLDAQKFPLPAGLLETN